MLDQPNRGFEPMGAPPPPRARARPLRVLIWAVISVIALIFLAWLILFITKGSFLKGPFERITSRVTQREVKVATGFQLYMNPLNIQFRFPTPNGRRNPTSSNRASSTAAFPSARCSSGTRRASGS